MSYLYLDTSAIVKRYTIEIGSTWLQHLLDPNNGNTVVVSEITLAEFAAAISAKHRAGTISLSDRTLIIDLFLSHCDIEYQLVEVNRNIIDRAVMLVQALPLRGYDSIQLSTALNSRDILAAVSITDFIFVCADTNLVASAFAEGLIVENPTDHP